MMRIVRVHRECVPAVVLQHRPVETLIAQQKAEVGREDSFRDVQFSHIVRILKNGHTCAQCFFSGLVCVEPVKYVRCLLELHLVEHHYGQRCWLVRAGILQDQLGWNVRIRAEEGEHKPRLRLLPL
jgi:hypothetical protein